MPQSITLTKGAKGKALDANFPDSIFETVVFPDATIGASLAEVMTIPVSGLDRIKLDVSVSVAPLAAFEIRCRSVPGGVVTTLYSASSDYTSPSGILVGTSSDLTTLAVNAIGWFIMETTGLYEVIIAARSSSTSTGLGFQVGGK